MKRAVRLLWLSALAAIVLAVSGVVSILGQRQEDEHSRSTYSTGSGGLAAMYRLVAAMGYRVSRNRTPLDELHGPPAVLVVAAGGKLPGASTDASTGAAPGWEEALRLTQHGWTVVLLGMAELAHAERALSLKVKERVATAEGSHPRFRGLRLEASHFLTKAPGGWSPLLVLGNDGVAMVRPEGMGWLVVCTEVEPFTNGRIGAGHHAEIAVGLVDIAAAGLDRVIFEETIHGVVDDATGTLWGRLGRPGRSLVYHSLLLFAVVVLSVGARLGYPRSERSKAPPLGEHITALARLYDRAGAYESAMESVRRHALVAAKRALALPQGASERDVLSQLAERDRLPFERASGPIGSAAEAATLCRQMDAVVKALRSRGTSRKG